MDFQDEVDSNPKPPRTRFRFASFRLYLNIFCLIVIAFGLWRAGNSALRNMRQIESQIDRRIVELTEKPKSEGSSLLSQSTEAQLLRQQKDSLWKLDLSWFFVSVLLICIGLAGPGIYWLLTLRALNIRVPWQIVSRAYYVGNLGKYVPGKAMVLVMRAAALKPFGATVKLTTISVFVETLTTMAVGAAIGALIILGMDVPSWLRMLGVGSAVCAVVPTLPFIFRPLLKLRLPANDPLSAALDRDYNYRLMIKGWCLTCFTWLLWGTSLYAAVQSVPLASLSQASHGSSPIVDSSFTVNEQPLMPAPDLMARNKLQTVTFWIVCVAACALSVVAGFVSLLPGGAGVRELVLVVLLSPFIGNASALIVAIAHRLSTIIGEVLVAAGSILIEWFLGKKQPALQK